MVICRQYASYDTDIETQPPDIQNERDAHPGQMKIDKHVRFHLLKQDWVIQMQPITATSKPADQPFAREANAKTVH